MNDNNCSGYHRKVSMGKNMNDPVNHPEHYTSHPAGIECIQITEHLDFLIGNIIKYAWRAGLKDGTTKLLDLEKCLWYAKRAVEREKNMSMVH